MKRICSKVEELDCRLCVLAFPFFFALRPLVEERDSVAVDGPTQMPARVMDAPRCPLILVPKRRSL